MIAAGGDVEVAMTQADRLRVAVLLSGTGRSLENLLAHRARGDLAIDIPVVVSTRPGVRGLEVAAAAGIAAHVVTRREAPTPERLSERVAALLAAHDIELIVLAGFLAQLRI